MFCHFMTPDKNYFMPMNFAAYFARLSDWKKLPAYKAEPRIDSLVGYYLPEILSAYLGREIIGIIPELPIRLGTVKPKHEGTSYADRSYKVDFLAVAKSDLCYLVEFKTDSGSRREAQDTYLKEARQVGVAAILQGIRRIASVSSFRKKYAHLLAKLQEYELLDAQPTARRFEIVYVQPSNPPGETNGIDFAWIADWLDARYSGEFEREFACTLRAWAAD